MLPCGATAEVGEMMHAQAAGDFAQAFSLGREEAAE
jgi:hypothetical protein